MFKLINQMLQLDGFYGVSKEIDIVKGINKYPETIKEVFKNTKRKLMAKNDCHLEAGSNMDCHLISARS